MPQTKRCKKCNYENPSFPISTVDHYKCLNCGNPLFASESPAPFGFGRNNVQNDYFSERQMYITHSPHSFPSSNSKALPIYTPNAGTKDPKIPINISIKERTPVKQSKKAEIESVRLLYDPPVVGTELKAIVYILDENGDRRFGSEFFEFTVRWFRGVRRMCCVKGCDKAASLQCLTCAKLKIVQRKSYFCSADHYASSWSTHKAEHAKNDKIKLVEWNESDGDYRLDELNAHGDKIPRGSAAFQCALNANDYECGRRRHDNLESYKALSQYFPPQSEGIWNDCGRNNDYVPKDDDAGRQILAECRLFDKITRQRVGCPARVWSKPVLPRYEIPPERTFVNSADAELFLTDNNERTFTVMTYNVLADIYAKPKAFPYVQQRFLEWNYRFPFIIAELTRYRCDFVCLQEMQYAHYQLFLQHTAPLGYLGVFKKKTRNSATANPDDVDGCAVLYDSSRFKLQQSFTIEFNEAADGLYRDAEGEWGETVRRLMRDNVAIVCSFQSRAGGWLLCVANTHIYWDPSCADVKLWQTMMLCSELENLNRRPDFKDVPIIICGDFNSKPDSAVYKILTTGAISSDNKLVKKDMHNIFEKCSLSHSLKLESAYKAVLGQEINFTNYTMEFKGCLDYILYSRELLKAISVLNGYEEAVLAEHQALPSPRFASDHIQLVAKFSLLKKNNV